MRDGIEFAVYGKVVGSARPRVTRNGTYIPRATREYRRAILRAFEECGGRKFDGEVYVGISVSRALPKSRPKRLLSEPDVFKPDVDNIAKNVLDALTGHAWVDDTQVVDLRVRKYPRTRTEERINVTIRPL